MVEPDSERPHRSRHATPRHRAAEPSSPPPAGPAAPAPPTDPARRRVARPPAARHPVEAAPGEVAGHRSRPGPDGSARPAWLPGPRLTGLGAGLLLTVLTLAAGAATALLLSGSGTGYGLLFCASCAVAALWVRPSDLLAAPIAAPTAFALGTLPLLDGGSSGRLMDLVTTLSLQAGWLYAGTSLAALLALARRVARRRVAVTPAPRVPGHRPGSEPSERSGRRVARQPAQNRRQEPSGRSPAGGPVRQPAQRLRSPRRSTAERVPPRR